MRYAVRLNSDQIDQIVREDLEVQLEASHPIYERELREALKVVLKAYSNGEDYDTLQAEGTMREMAAERYSYSL